MKKAKFRIVLFSLSACTVLILSLFGLLKLRMERMFPFSTGTDDRAFLDTTFGMSVPEVRRALRKHKAKLVDSDKEVVEYLLPPLSFKPLFSDEQKGPSRYSLYMPSIEMYRAEVQAKFDFWDDKLASVTVYFRSVFLSQSAELAETIQNKLRNQFEFVAKEESLEVPGAYSLRFDSGYVKPNLWVNLTDSKKPIIKLYMTYQPYLVDKQVRVRKRELDIF